MNCQQVQDLMPLYVGGELQESCVRPVAAHLQNCETCSGVAHEYRETRLLLQTFVPPAFTGDLYAEMRQGVWEKIEKKSTGPAFFGIVGHLFPPRLAWGLATAVLIAASVVGISVMSRRSAAPQPVVSRQPPKNQTTQDDKLSISSQNDPFTDPSLVSSRSNSRRTSVPQLYVRQKRKTIPDHVNLPAVSTVAAVSPTANSAPEANDLREPSNGSSDASQTPLRMEIQTKNPNIRIIWFAPRDAKSSSPNSRGT